FYNSLFSFFKLFFSQKAVAWDMSRVYSNFLDPQERRRSSNPRRAFLHEATD
ncbi:hypothetical protein IFM89_018943, partial [Coptis chinensis]